MEMIGEQRIEASRERVWAALNDPDILRQCIPGCEEMEKLSDTEFTAKVTAKVGPVKAKFTGSVTLADLDPPESYTILGEGKGGAAGFAKGGARVRLEPDGGATVMRYEVQANVGGKLAQLGNRLIDGTARKMADDFFTRFTALVHDGAAAAPEAEPAPAAAGRPAAAIEPGAAFPPAQPDYDAAAAAATQHPHIAGAAPESPAPSGPEAGAPQPAAGLSPILWISGLIVLVLALILIFAL